MKVNSIKALVVQQQPEALIQIDNRFLKKDSRYCCDLALVNMSAKVRAGDRVLVGTAPESMKVMRLRRMKDGWCFEPLKCSRLMPWFVKTYEEFLIVKVERVFSMLEDTPCDEPRTV